MHSITAIIVLYKRSAQQSAAYQSLLQLVKQSPDPPVSHILLFDNSPDAGTAQALPAEMVTYHAAKENCGLAPAYNLALRRSIERGDEWLLLLDQDTVLHREYVQELADLAQHLSSQASVGAIVPKLSWNGVIYSPEANLLDQLRSQFPHRSHAVAAAAVGLQPRRLAAYNSGALLRVSALQAIGGFPSEFWLDYLDHAVFHLLAEHGYRIHLMRSTLQHPLAHVDPNAVPLWRERNVLTAQTMWVRRFGTLLDRLLYRIFLLRMSWRSLRESSDRRVGLEKLLQAVLLRVPALALGGTER